MTFDDLLDKIWGFDAEIFSHDSLFVFISYRTGERVVFHNSDPNDIQNFLDNKEPILLGYNCNNYDKWILKCWLSGYTPEELKDVNDYIINGGKGWELDTGYIDLPIMWDLFNEINPRKSLKEIEGNLRLDITETTVPFDLPTKWTEQQYKDVLYYCTCDVKALFPLFDKLKTKYKSKFIIAKFGNIEPAFALSQTNANLTAILLGAEKKEYTDNFNYVYPECIDKNKIPKEALDYFDDIIRHNDLNYNPPAPNLELKDIFFQLGLGGGHGFKKTGTYYYDINTSKKLLCNWDFTSLYPNLVRLFGYSSRSQSSKNGYVEVLATRMKAKKGLLSDNFLKPMQLTNKDLNTGLKLPLNAYTGALRAKFNKLYDNLQGFSICTTGQLIILQLIYDLEQVPTVELVSANTDAVMFEVDEEYKEETDKIIHDLEKLTGLEMEEDNIVRIIMANVNNYCELVQTGENDYTINYKGGRFQFNSIEKNLKMIWDKDKKTWITEFTDDVKSNSLTIVGEAVLKKLLLDIPVEKTINECEDIFRFQIISHLGSTYEKCVQESLNNNINNDAIEHLEKELHTLEKERDKMFDDVLNNINNDECYDYNELYDSSYYKEITSRIKNIEIKISNLLHPNDIDLQRNNRIYAGKKPSGIIVKIKPDGRRDSLADCPPNPIIDNANKCTIDDINKEWYIEMAKQRVNDFLGVKRLEEYKKDELIEKANSYGIEFNKKTKKSDLIEMIKNHEKQLTNKIEYDTISNERRNELMTKQELEEKLEQAMSQNEKLVEKLKEKENKEMSINMEDLTNDKLCKLSLLKKLNEFRKKVRERKFVFDKELPNNLGGGEYYSIDQFYNAVQEIALEVGLDFTFETVELMQFDKELTKPSGKLPIHVATVKTLATFTDIDTGFEKQYITIAQGSDTIDKAVASASSMAFRNWFYKNFTPKGMTEDDLDDMPEERSEPKIPVYVPEQKKEEIKKEVVKQVQQEESDKEDIKVICDNIMKIREKIGNPEYGNSTLNILLSGNVSSADIMSIDLKIKNKMESVGLE